MQKVQPDADREPSDLVQHCLKRNIARAPDNMHTFISITPISSQNSMFDHLLESSHQESSLMKTILTSGLT